MNRSVLRNFSRFALFTLAVLTLLATSTAHSFAQTTAKKVVKTENDLPRFNYPIAGTATELLNSDDATFNVDRKSVV